MVFGFGCWVGTGFGNRQKSSASSQKQIQFLVVKYDEKKSENEALLLNSISDFWTVLISKKGEVLQEWKSCCIALSSSLNEQGDLVLLTKEKGPFRAGVWGQIQRLNRNSEVMWNYEDPRLHHEVWSLANRNYLSIKYKALTSNLQKKIRPLLNSKVIPASDELSCDEIVEINENHQIVWSLAVEEILTIDAIDFKLGRFPLGQFDRIEALGLTKFCHTNAVRQYENTSLSSQPLLLISVRNFDQLVLLEKYSKKVLWRSPRGALLRPHDPRLYKNEILVYNNNSKDSYHKTAPSEIVAFNIKDQTIEKFFGKNGPQRRLWGSPFLGGVLRSQSGNLLISDSDSNQIFEMNESGKIVFKMQVFQENLEKEFGNAFYHIEAYPTDQIERWGFLR